MVQSKQQRGIALVLVLASIVLITVLVLAALTSVSVFTQTTRAGNSNSVTRSLADDAVSIVTAQIRDATTLSQTNSWASQPGMIRTYNVSTTPGIGANQANLYKLYSSAIMVLDGTQAVNQGTGLLSTIAADVPATWNTTPDIYTDLNSPVIAADGSTLVFPVVDPRAWSNPSTPAVPIPTNNWTGTGTNDVQGFTYTTAPVTGLANNAPIYGSTIAGITNPASSTINDPNARLPMPCRWLYVRKSGYISAGTDQGNGVVQIPDDPNVPTGTANANPVVGRIAFWTDDDTSKVNINTACGDLWSPDTEPITAGMTSAGGNANTFVNQLNPPGSYWAIPRVGSWYDEFVLSPQIPLKNEFQRYGGHPATVYLSAVFPQFSGPQPILNGATARDQLYGIIPRVNGGTATTGGASAPNMPGETTLGGTQMPSGATNDLTFSIAPKHDRLYASIDELLYGTTRATNLVITPAALQRAKFFITTDSKAPELNLFNLPRISMWPINNTYSPTSLSPYCTPTDQLLAYCSSLGPNYYFFQRRQQQSVADDGSYDAGIAQNQNIYKYLQYLTAQNIPGYGGNLAAKYVIPASQNNYSTGRDAVGTDKAKDEMNQILTEIWDYIRCINVSDPNLAYTPTNYQFSPADAQSTLGSVAPLYNNNNGSDSPTIGFGRFMTIGEVGLQFVATGSATPKTTLPMKPAGIPVKAVLLLEGHAVSSSLPFIRIKGLKVVVSNLPTQSSLTWTLVQGGSLGPSVPLYFPNSTGTLTYSNPINNSSDGVLQVFPEVNSPTPIGGADSTMAPMYPVYGTNYPPQHALVSGGGRVGFADTDSSSPYTALVSSSPTTPDPTMTQVGTNVYTFTQIPTTVPPVVGMPNSKAGFFLRTPTNLTISVMMPGATNTVNVYMNALSNWVMPIYATSQMPRGTHTPNPPDELQQSDSLLTMVPGYPRWAYTSPHAGGDYRLLAGLANSPFGYWVPEGRGDPSWTTNHPTSIAHNFSSSFTFSRLFDSANAPGVFQDGVNSGYAQGGTNGLFMYNGGGEANGSAGYDFGTLIDITNYPNIQNSGGYDAWGDIPLSPPTPASFATNFWTEYTHDFDQGAGATQDGAFINHPEEATILELNGTGGTSPYYQGYYFSVSDSGQGLSFEKNSISALSTFSSPNRLVPSPAIMGSLPTGVAEGIPWKTLLFRAQPEHPGAGGFNASTPVSAALIQSPPYAPSSDNVTRVPDHLFLDLFWMPVAEPYAISDTFSTSGKVNMNYQIMPFTYIDRATAMQAVLRSQRMAAVPSNQIGLLKEQSGGPTVGATGDPRVDFRHDLNLSTQNGGTLMQFENKFASGDIFHSASQICDVFMVPLTNAFFPNSPAGGFGSSTNTVESAAYNYWNNTSLASVYPNNVLQQEYTTFTSTNFPATNYIIPAMTPVTGYKLTGGNERDLPYANIYSLLTTKSNTYTVHMRVQSLKQARVAGRDYVNNAWSDPAVGTGTDIVTGEYRGSATLERYLDLSDPNLSGGSAINFTTAAVNSPGTTLSPYYKYRVTSTKQFAP